MSESLHSALVENLFDEEEALLNLHMNVIQGKMYCIWMYECIDILYTCIYKYIFINMFTRVYA